MQAANILEIGCEYGYSSYMLATAAKENGGTYFCIEKSSAWISQLCRNLVAGDFPHVAIWSDSTDIHEFPWTDSLDFILLDGEHSLNAVTHEFHLLYPKLRRVGYIAIHDIETYSSAGFQAILDNPEYDFEYITFTNNYGLALLRRREENWFERMAEIVKAAEFTVPVHGWVTQGDAPPKNNTLVVSSTVSTIESQWPEGWE